MRISARPRSEDEGVLAVRRERADEGIRRNPRSPLGLRQWYRIATLRIRSRSPLLSPRHALRSGTTTRNAAWDSFERGSMGKVKEIIVKQYRVVFFTIGTTGYVVDVFKKQSRKTPKRIIERAERIYRSMSN